MLMVLALDLVVFFFQAEDGIRDGTVTGVQTCALPILEILEANPVRRSVLLFGGDEHDRCHAGLVSRSEEHTSELQSQFHLVCRLLLEKKKTTLITLLLIKKKKKKNNK